MRELHLIRHAKSSWDDPRLPDYGRPLNARGVRDASNMASRFAATFTPPAMLLSSPAKRAWQTAVIFARALRISDQLISREPAIYEASAGGLLDVICDLNDDVRLVLLFGHNPGISELAHQLAECPFRTLPTCGIASLALDVSRWRDVSPGHGRFLAYRYPKQHQQT